MANLRAYGVSEVAAHCPSLEYLGPRQKLLLETYIPFGFGPEHILGDEYRRRSHSYATDWYYYVFTKPSEK